MALIAIPEDQNWLRLVCMVVWCLIMMVISSSIELLCSEFFFTMSMFIILKLCTNFKSIHHYFGCRERTVKLRKYRDYSVKKASSVLVSNFSNFRKVHEDATWFLKLHGLFCSSELWGWFKISTNLRVPNSNLAKYLPFSRT